MHICVQNELRRIVDVGFQCKWSVVGTECEARLTRDLGPILPKLVGFDAVSFVSQLEKIVARRA